MIKNNDNKGIILIYIISFLISIILGLFAQMTINSIIENGYNLMQIISPISSIIIICAFILSLKYKRLGGVIIIISSIILGISVSISSNKIINMLPASMAIGFVFFIIPFLIGLCFLSIKPYKQITNSA